MTSASGDGVVPRFGSFAHLLAEARDRLGHPSTPVRWVVLAVTTVAGWVAIALWLPTPHGHFDGHENLWPVMVTCGLVGIGQAYAQFFGQERVEPRSKKKKTRTALLRWWGVLALIAVHIAVVCALAAAIVPVTEDDSRFSAGADVLFLGFFGWALGPIIALLAVVIVVMTIGLTSLGFTDLEKASRAPRGLPRARLTSNGIALLGLMVALLALIAAIPWLGVPGGGRGAALAAAIVLLLEAVHVMTPPPGVWLLVDRIAYLVGIVAVLQAPAFALWVKLTGRSESQASAEAGHDAGVFRPESGSRQS